MQMEPRKYYNTKSSGIMTFGYKYCIVHVVQYNNITYMYCIGNNYLGIARPLSFGGKSCIKPTVLITIPDSHSMERGSAN